ncbi:MULTISPECIES: hypothetical protein [Bacteroidales]|uniref:hypothetical protein n=1 Tax=Bacteroidales TaxID=171549 RepID=UPI0026E26CC6|nr:MULTISPECIES: hypothetical protein [Bacteroidales]
MKQTANATATSRALERVLLWVLGLVAVVGIFAVPDDDSAHWLTILVTTKVVGIAALWAIERKLKSTI